MLHLLRDIEDITIGFAVWLAENHWKAYNSINGIMYWVSESEEELGEQTTKQLYDIYIKPK